MKTVQELQLELRRIDGQIQEMRERQSSWTTADAGKVSRLVDQAEDILTLLDESKAREKMLVRSSSRVTSTAPEHSVLESSSGAFHSFDEQMRAIMSAGSPGGQTDDRLFEGRATGAGSQPSLGGFMIQQDFADELIGSLYRPGTLLSMVRKYPISPKSNSLSMPGFDETSRANGSRWGGIQGYWTGEAAEKTASKPKFRKIEMELVKLAALCYTTDELVEDTGGALANYLRDAFLAEFTFKLEDAILNGTGSGQPLGIANSGALVSASAEVGQPATTILWDNITKMLARFKPLNPNKSIWVANIDCLPQLMSMALTVGTSGVPVYQPGGSDGVNRLCGYPVIYSEAAATLGTVMDLVLMDPQAYLMIEKGGIQTEKSIHVRFIYDESVFRFVYRVNGQPMFAEATTPFKGSDTVSPFVAIATRS